MAALWWHPWIIIIKLIRIHVTVTAILRSPTTATIIIISDITSTTIIIKVIIKCRELAWRMQILLGPIRFSARKVWLIWRRRSRSVARMGQILLGIVQRIGWITGAIKPTVKTFRRLTDSLNLQVVQRFWNEFMFRSTLGFLLPAMINIY